MRHRFKEKICNTKTLCQVTATTLFLALWFCYSTSNAQEAFTSAGGNIAGEGGFASITAGQLHFHVLQSDGGTIIQGVQQPYEWIVTHVAEDLEHPIVLSAYPNPTSDKLTLEIGEETGRHLVYQLFNLRGELIRYERIVQSEVNISMGHLAAGVYLLRVLDNNRELKTFRIIKH